MLTEKLEKIARIIGYTAKPDFLIIGAQKAGTSSLFSILKQHQFIKPSSTKEIHYFDQDDWYNKKRLYQYHSYFPFPHDLSKNDKVFEATPRYLYHPKVAERLYNYNKNLKLIVMLRNPAERALSSWTMFHHNFQTGNKSYLFEPRSFKEVIETDLKTIDTDDFYTTQRGYVKRGIYHFQIENYFKYFNRNQIHFLEDIDLKNDFENTLRKIFLFIGVPYEELKLEFLNKSSVNTKDSYHLEIEMLKEFYKPYNKKLYELLGKDYRWDS